MADCHNLFQKFNEVITLTPARKDDLRISRNALRLKIKEYIKTNKPNELQPHFHGQGSFCMNTAVNPVQSESGYDLDDGVYFIGKAEERKTVVTYHTWIHDAVKAHTNDVKDKNTCVRVVYSDSHHIDIPIYFVDKDAEYSIPLLAHKGKDWIESDPKAFVDWFQKKKSEQSARLVKYLKAWADFNKEGYTVLPGIILTILLINNYSPDDRDDVAFNTSVKNIKYELDTSFSCYRPTPDAQEDLLQKYAENKGSISQGLQALIDDGDRAINQKNQKSACEYWQSQFGPRFSCSNAKDELEDAHKFDNPAVINTSAKSA